MSERALNAVMFAVACVALPFVLVYRHIRYRRALPMVRQLEAQWEAAEEQRWQRLQQEEANRLAAEAKATADRLRREYEAAQAEERARIREQFEDALAALPEITPHSKVLWTKSGMTADHAKLMTRLNSIVMGR